MKLTVGNKIGLITLTLTLLIIASGLAGLYSVNRLSDSLAFVTTRAWDAADGSMEATIELQGKLFMTEKVFTGTFSEAEAAAKFSEFDRVVAGSIQRIETSELLDTARIKEFKRAFQRYNELQGKTIASHHALIKLNEEAGANLSKLDQLLMKSEDTIEESMDDNALLNLTPSEIQVLWDAADATMETRIGLLQASHAISRTLDGHGSPETAETYETGIALAREQVEALAKSPLIKRMTLDGQAAGPIIVDLAKQQQELYRQLLTRFQSFSALKSELNGSSANIVNLLGAIEEEADTRLESEVKLIDGVVSTAVTSVLSAIVIGILIAIAAYVASIKLIVSPIRAVSERLQDIAENGGDLTQSMPVRGNDEVTDLSNAFNQFMAKTRDIIAQIKHSSRDVADGAGTLSKIINETNDGALRQKGETEQVASAVSQLVSTVSSVASHANDAASVSQNANSSTTEGKQLVRQTVNMIQKLAADMKSASQVINQVQVEADNIGGVLDVIQGIAEQTNLLALNAAIEAARAGEQGRGFAVVADEVRTLASRTQESTTEIKTMIETLQQGSRNAVDVITRSHDQSDQSAQHVLEADQALDRIVEAISGILSINEQIATATREQEVASKQIGSSAENIYSIAESTAEKATAAQNATMQLSDRSCSMSELVAQFKT